MSTYRQTLLHDLTVCVAFLRGETGVHSNNCVPSSLSLFTQNVEECAPTSVQDALCQAMILDHVENAQLLHRDHPVLVGIAFGGLILEVTALTGNLEMRLCRTTSSLAASVRTFLAAAYLALFAPERLLRGAVIAWVLNGVALTIRQERFQPNINADITMLTYALEMVRSRFGLTHDEGIPMSIRT